MALVPFSPPPGYNPDATSFEVDGQWWADINHFRFKKGRPETIGGAVEFGAATTARARKMLLFDLSGTTTLAVAGDSLVITAPGGGSATDITPAANWNAAKMRCLDMFGDVLLALESTGRLFESSGGAQATAVTNAPTQSTAMLVTPSRQVMLLGTKEEGSGTFNGRCIRWSDIEDRTSWTTLSTNNAGEYILPGQEDIVGACLLGDYILIWTEGSLWLAQFVGDPGATFSFQRIDGGAGLCGLNAHAVYRNVAYWISPRFGFYSYALGGIIERIPCPAERTAIDAGALSNMFEFFVCPNSAHGEVWFCYLCNLDDGAQKYLAYCVDESIAAQRPVWFTGSFEDALGTDISAGAIVDGPIQWDTLGYYTQMIVAAWDSSVAKKVWRWDCAAQAPGISGSYIKSGDFYLDESQRRVMVRRFIPDFETQGGTVSLTLTVRDRPMSSATTKGPYSIATTDTKKDFRASGKIVNVKFSTASAIRVRLGKPEFDVVPLGER